MAYSPPKKSAPAHSHRNQPAPPTPADGLGRKLKKPLKWLFWISTLVVIIGVFWQQYVTAHPGSLNELSEERASTQRAREACMGSIWIPSPSPSRRREYSIPAGAWSDYIHATPGAWVDIDWETPDKMLKLHFADGSDFCLQSDKRFDFGPRRFIFKVFHEQGGKLWVAERNQ